MSFDMLLFWYMSQVQFVTDTTLQMLKLKTVARLKKELTDVLAV